MNRQTLAWGQRAAAAFGRFGVAAVFACVAAGAGLLLQPRIAWAAAATGVVPAERMTDWTAVGCPEPLPRPAAAVDATAYGAVGDASAPAQSAIAAAIAALAGKPGVVLLPAGTYLLTAPINLPSGVVLRGAGAGVSPTRTGSERITRDLSGLPSDPAKISPDFKSMRRSPPRCVTC